MTIDHGDQSITALEGYAQPMVRRNTNTVIFKLKQDEVLALVGAIATRAYGGSVTLVVESDTIYAKDME